MCSLLSRDRLGGGPGNKGRHWGMLRDKKSNLMVPVGMISTEVAARAQT